MSQKLSIEEQEQLLVEIRKKDINGSLQKNLILQGIIDPQPIRDWHKAKLAFKTQDADAILVRDKAIRLAAFDDPTLILGESGTGKELLARILHGERTGYFVGVNVCAVTETLFESELFGHMRGSFTGADRERDGLLQHAEHGTLFLDEIGDMPLELQAKLLRVINNRVYRKVGSNVDLQLSCRIIAATHRDLTAMIKNNLFRLDLLERLQVFKLRIKPLRDRWKDAELYAGKEFIDVLERHVSDTRSRYFSGNVRQLLNLKRRFEVFGETEINEEDCL